MDSLASTLQTYGGWGVAAVCIVAIILMARYIVKLHADDKEESKATIKAQREETRATVTALVETRDAMRSFTEAMNNLATKLETG